MRLGFGVPRGPCFVLFAPSSPSFQRFSRHGQPSVITTDDMSNDSMGVFGCKMKGRTPNMDRLAARRPALQTTRMWSWAIACPPATSCGAASIRTTTISRVSAISKPKRPIRCSVRSWRGGFHRHPAQGGAQHALLALSVGCGPREEKRDDVKTRRRGKSGHERHRAANRLESPSASVAEHG